MEELCFINNKLTSLPNLPNSLEILKFRNNQLTNLPDLPDLPNSLQELTCYDSQLILLPNFYHINHEIRLCFFQYEPMKYIPYNKNLKLCSITNNKINIEGYPYNPITNQEELDKYMKFIKNYERNKIKSDRK